MTAASARRFAAAAQQTEESLRAAFPSAGVDWLELSTEDDLLDAVVRFAQMRKQRHKTASRRAQPLIHERHFKLPLSTALRNEACTCLPLSFLSPEYLWLLLLVPLAVGLYLCCCTGARKAAVRYGNFGLVKQALGAGNWIRRHIPPALLLLALLLMVLAIARPTAVMSLPSHKSTVMLAMDVSGSMRATDVKPSRVEAMQAAAKAYIDAAAQGSTDRHRRLRRQRLSGADPHHRSHQPRVPPSIASNCSAAPRWAAAS